MYSLAYIGYKIWYVYLYKSSLVTELAEMTIHQQFLRALGTRKSCDIN
jgi:hypothetical protein